MVLQRLFALAVLVAHALTAGAQPPPGRVLLFPDPSFRGEPLVLTPGEVIDNLHYRRQPNGKRWNDSISSIRIEGPVRLVIYGDAHFKGERLELRRDQSDLTTQPHGPAKLETWDDRISSLKVESLDFGQGPPDARPPEFRNQREADRAIRAAYLDLLGREPDFDGYQNYRRRLLDQGWSDARLRTTLRDSPEFKARDFDAVVRKVFKEVLGREPDASGLATYRSRLREGWSENDLRADLKRSDEAKDRLAREIVTQAYRDLLGRDPDPSGLETYTNLILKKGWTDQRVRDTLRGSEEYRNRPKP
ncbi:MAG: DUF4214 domain-containing protein [Opitutaceae bacterium]